jgi:RND family efflux transporter MFP subunit
MQQVFPLWRGAALAILFLAGACSGAPTEQAPPPPNVTVSTPLEREVVDWDEYVGRFEAVEDVELRPRVSGTVERVMFTDGQNVSRGQALFTIDRRPYEAAAGQARAQVSRASAMLANARTELARAKRLLDVEAISREEYETKLANVRTAQADVEAGRAALRAAELDLGFTTVRSPISGRVSDRRVSKGNFVAAGETVLTRVVSYDPIWFSFDGAESFYLKYMRQDRSGERGSSRNTPNPVEVQLADESGYNWRGRMDFVDNAIDTDSGTIRAHAVIPNPDGFLTPGMFGRARLLGSGTYRAMLVPDEAIATDQTRKLVYVVAKENKVAPRVIETGPVVEGLRVVKKGLAATDLVIVNGIDRIQPGMVVTPRKVPMKPRAENTAPVSRPASAPAPSEAGAPGNAD